MDSQTLAKLSPKARAELIRKRAEEVIATNSRITNNPDPVLWIEENFYIPELKGPMKLMPYQKAALYEATRKDEKGNFIYSTVVWSDIKKSIKSCIAAAVALWRGFAIDWGSIILVANDLKQADSRVGFYMRRAIELNPRMKALCTMRNFMVKLPNRTTIEAVSIDPTGEAGSNADMVVFSELWGAHQEAQKRMWTETTLPPNKFGRSQRWVETYAGYSGESPLLEQLYEVGLMQGRQLDVGIPGLELYANDAARTLVLWNTTPRCYWQTPEYYAQETAALPPNEFLRVHRNQWVTSLDTFVPMEWWDACLANEDHPMVSLRPEEQLVFGIDAAVSNDCFAIVGVSRRDTTVTVRYCQIWYPPPGGKIDFTKPEAEIRRLAEKYNVVEWAYDEYQLHDMAKRLGREGMGWFRPFSQARERLVGDKNLQDLIRERRIVHDGDSKLREHIQNSNAKLEGDKLRIVKRSELMKIDAAVALSMASAEAVRLNIG